jgi:hypothetical protein
MSTIQKNWKVPFRICKRVRAKILNFHGNLRKRPQTETLLCSDFTLKRKFMLQKIPFDQRREGNDLPINAIVIGDRKIGKTNFISRFLTDSDTKRKGFVSQTDRTCI